MPAPCACAFGRASRRPARAQLRGVACAGVAHARARAQVHYGMVLPSGFTHPQAIGPFGAPVSENCGSWLHLSNMFIARTDRKKMIADAAGWHWIFARIDTFWAQPEWADVLQARPAAARTRTRRRGMPQDLEKALSLANVNIGR